MAIPRLELLEELPSPYEIFDVPPETVQEFDPQRYELGKGFIRPARAPEGVWVPILRIWVTRATKPLGAPYWDITAKTLIVTLLPVIDDWIARRLRFRARKVGIAPRARFEIEVIPTS